MPPAEERDHGGNIDIAAQLFGGPVESWIDLSTGINPLPYPVPEISATAWGALPRKAAQEALTAAARDFWRVPEGAEILAVPGLSAAIAQIPHVTPPGLAWIPSPTYNEHAASFAAAGWQVVDAPDAPPQMRASVLVHPNNPDGRLWKAGAAQGSLRVIDESFCDTHPAKSLIGDSITPGTLVLKSFGKFWGLAGLRLGFVIGCPEALAPLRQSLGPWPVSGPALEIGTRALRDTQWARHTRQRLQTDAARLDAMVQMQGATCVGGTSLFRLYHVQSAQDWQIRLAGHRIWSRVFPYDRHWLRLGLPGPGDWTRLEAALT